MANVKVSNDFNNFMARNSKAVEDAKTAENTMATCAMPIGWEGQCICVDAVADKSKDKKDQDGKVKEGSPYIRLEFSVVGDESYTGKKFSRLWMFNDTAKATAADRFEWCLNEMENLGLPQETRKTFDSVEELLKHFIDSDAVYECEVNKSDYSRDGKEMKVRLSAEAVDMTDSVVPTGPASDEPEDDTVMYLGKKWEVVSKEGKELTIKSMKTGQTKVVTTDDLD